MLTLTTLNKSNQRNRVNILAMNSSPNSVSKFILSQLTSRLVTSYGPGQAQIVRVPSQRLAN